MSDPFSSVSAALGVVSFGITVCKGLVSYLNAIKERRKELRDTLEDTATLMKVLQSLIEILPRIVSSRPDSAAVLLRCLQQAKSRLVALRDLVAKLAGLPPEQVASLALPDAIHTPSSSAIGLKASVKDTGRALLYRFNQDDLKSVRQAILQLVDILNLALLTDNL